MSALPRTAAALLLASLTVLGGAAAASADDHDGPGYGYEYEIENGGDFNSVHHETNIVSFGDLVVD
ncbi:MULTISPECIES: hypothetical protein [Streptomyces]|uniref:Uncharacterized protein n=1 Tax=Streptomyces cremeus TaxID=66881 RepID=A0ABV5P9K0_STRCM